MTESRTWSGLWTALVTPFHKDEIDKEFFGKLVEEQVQAGLRGITVLGTTGEASTVTSAEREKIYEQIREQVDSRCMLMAGVGTNCTRTTLEEIKRAQDFGMDCALVVSPYYNKPTQEGLLAHFLTLADASEIPLVLYNVPGRTAVALETNTMLQLLEHPQIIGVKEATGHLQNVEALVQRSPRSSEWSFVFSGDDALTYAMMCLGAHGTICVASNLLPKSMQRMLACCEAGQYEEARTLHHAMSPLFHAAFLETNPGPIKYLVAKKYGRKEELRLPLVSPREETRKELDKVLQLLRDQPLLQSDFE